MKKKIILLLILFCCFFTTKNVYADVCAIVKDFYEAQGMTITEVKPAGEIKNVHLKDRVNIFIRVKGTLDETAKYSISFKSVNPGLGTDAIAYLDNTNFVTSSTEEGNAEGKLYMASFVIDSVHGFKEGVEYKYDYLEIEATDKNSGQQVTNSLGEEVTVYQKNCGIFVINPESTVLSVDNVVLENNFGSTFKVVSEEEGKKDGPDLLKSFTLNSQSNKFYIGDKITFNVETTEDFGYMNVSFYNPVSLDGHQYGMFTVYLTPDGPKNGNVRSYSGYIPKTLSGYGASSETGRTEIVIYPGNYYVNSIFFYNVKGSQYVRYTNKKEFADSGEFLYFDPKITIDLKEPKGDELNDVNFVIDELKLNSNKAAIGGQVPLNLKYSYDNTNKIVKSIYFIFKGINKSNSFTTYIKGLPNNPSFIIPSSADNSSYRLDSIGVTFESTDGTSNTVMFDSKSNSGKYSEIFKQELVVDASNGNMVNGKAIFSTEELSSEVYRMIQESNEKNVTVDADNETLIPVQLFDVIKDSNKNLIIKYQGNEYVFKGEDIKSPKDLDVLMKLYNISDSNMSETLKDGLNGDAVVVEFANNGELPGSALIRVKESDLINKLNTDKYYIYYADTENDKLDKVALEVQKTSDGYIEFYVNHHSKYVITTQEVKKEEVIGKDDEVLESNEELVVSKKTNDVVEEKKESKNVLIFVLIGVIAVLVIALVVVIILRNKKKPKIEEKPPIVSEPLEVDNPIEEEKKEE